jgi:hypothetical protein
MSLMIELASCVGGAMSEYALQKRWGSFKIFALTSCVFFIMFTGYFLLFPPVKGLVLGLAGAAILALGLGMVNAMLIRFALRQKLASAHKHLSR